MTRDALSWQIIRKVISRRLINFFDVSSPSTRTIIMQSVKLFISFSVSIYLEAYCAVFPFNDILIYGFIWQAGIGAAWMYLPNGEKREEKRETWKRNWWEVLSTGKFFRHCSGGNWRYRDAVDNFGLRRMEYRKRADCREGNGVRNDTKFRHNCTTLHFLCASVKERDRVVESVGSNFSGLLAYSYEKKSFIGTEEVPSRRIFVSYMAILARGRDLHLRYIDLCFPTCRNNLINIIRC